MMLRACTADDIIEALKEWHAYRRSLAEADLPGAERELDEHACKKMIRALTEVLARMRQATYANGHAAGHRI